MIGHGVSIVIPTKDRKEILAETLTAISQMDYPKDKFEVIVVIDKNCDYNIQEQLKEIKEKTGLDLNYFNSEFRSVVNRNLGISHAKYPFIGCLDDDTSPESDWIKKMLSAFKDDKVGFAYGDTVTPEQLIYPWRVSPMGHKGATCNMMYRKDVINSIGGMDPKTKYHNDIDLELKVAAAGYYGVESGAKATHHVEILNARGIIKKSLRHKEDVYYYTKYPKQMDRFVGKPFIPVIGPFSFLGLSIILSIAAAIASLLIIGPLQTAAAFASLYLLIFVVFFVYGYRFCLRNNVRKITLYERVKTFCLLNLHLMVYVYARILGLITFRTLVI